MAALLSGGALMRKRVPSSESKVTPSPEVSPRLPLTVEHFPVRAGLFLQGISAAPALSGTSSIIATATLRTTDLLQALASRFGQEQDSNHGDGDRDQQPLNGGAMGAQTIIKQSLQRQGRRSGAAYDGIAQAAHRGAIMGEHDFQGKPRDDGVAGEKSQKAQNPKDRHCPGGRLA